MKVKDVLIFLLGVAVGAGGTYLFLHKNYADKEAKLNEEMEKLDKGRNKDNHTEPKKEIIEEPKEPDLTIYNKVLNKTDYNTVKKSEPVTTMTDASKDETKQMIETAKKITKKPKVPKKVTQDEFDSTSEDERRTLYFYADGVLADDEDEVYDPTEVMGATNFKQFKSTYDTVYIFNYAHNFMYEIIPSNSKYSDIVGGDVEG